MANGFNFFFIIITSVEGTVCLGLVCQTELCLIRISNNYEEPRVELYKIIVFLLRSCSAFLLFFVILWEVKIILRNICIGAKSIKLQKIAIIESS